jgi:thiol-disulfide isomerase/thioredoxin
MSKDISKVVFKVEDETTWDQMMELSESKLVVVDCHQEWCGYCEAIHPTISRVFLDYDGAEERFVYASASIGKVAGKLQSTFPADAHINLEKNGCLPLFAIIRVSFFALVFFLFSSLFCLQWNDLNLC